MYFKMMPQKLDHSAELMQGFIDHYARIIESAIGQDRLHLEIVWVINNALQFADELEKQSDLDINLQKFIHKCSKVFFQHSDIQPIHIKRLLKELKKRPSENKLFIDQFLESLKDNKYDVKSLELGDLLDLVGLIA
jgi:hypothetical protein